MKIREWWSRCRLWCERHATSLYALVLVILMGLLALAPGMFIDVPAGHAGVLWRRFAGGTVTDRMFPEGMRFIAVWDKMEIYDLRLHNDSRTFTAVASNGMSIAVDVAVRYRINPPEVGLLHKVAGPGYAETLIYPTIASLIYEYISNRSPEEFYSEKRGDFERFLKIKSAEELRAPTDDVNYISDRYAEPLIQIEDVMITSVSFPQLVSQAIDRKVEQQQIMQEYDFRIEREQKEAVRKQIEARGIRAFQDEVASNITPGYLRLRGIEATKAFADSTNAKTIIIGGRDGLPVILNTGDDGGKEQGVDGPAPKVRRSGTAAIANPPSSTPPNAVAMTPAQ